MEKERFQSKDPDWWIRRTKQHPIHSLAPSLFIEHVFLPAAVLAQESKMCVRETIFFQVLYPMGFESIILIVTYRIRYAVRQTLILFQCQNRKSQ